MFAIGPSDIVKRVSKYKQASWRKGGMLKVVTQRDSGRRQIVYSKMK